MVHQLKSPEAKFVTCAIFLWASIDNDDSRDLDQLTVAEAMPAEKVKILVAIADVDAVYQKWISH